MPATWSPDGRRALLVDFDDSEREGVVLIDFTTEQPTARQLVPLAAGDVDSLLWAPDSLAFAYERNA